MRLLFDETLSPQLLTPLADLFPGSTHVRDVGLAMAGVPPKVVWIRRGNCSTRDIENLLRQHHAELLAFEQDDEAAFLALG